MNLVVGSPEWIAKHRTGVFGTDVAKILGVSRFGGPMDVYLEKQGLTAPLIQSEAMEWGTILEEPVARKYATKTGRKIRRAAGFLARLDAPHHGANIDRWSDLSGTPRRVLEVKTAGEFAASDFGSEGTDEVPPDYLLQLMWYLHVTQRDRGDMAVLVGGQKHRIYQIERDPDLIADMVEIVDEFWRNQLEGVPPPVDGSEGSSLYLARTFKDAGTQREMTDELAELALKYASLKADEKVSKALISEYGNRIRLLMGDHRTAEGGGVKVTYSERKGATTVRWAEMVATLPVPPSLIEEYTTTADPIRTLLVTVNPA